MGKSKLVVPENVAISTTPKKIKAVHPFGSKILVEMLKPDEILGTTLYIDDKTKIDTAAQGYIVEVGAGLSDSGIQVGQRVYWEGRGIPVEDPRSDNERVRAILEIHNIKAIIEEE
jgi:hypothetical protein